MRLTKMNLFDLVPANQSSQEQRSHSSGNVRRVCTYKSRFGTPCDRDAEPNALVCKAHGGSKTSLIELRKQAISMGPLVLDRLEEIIVGDNDLVATQAAKLWSEIAGVKDIPSIGSGLDEEELSAAKRSLDRKFESVMDHLLKRKSA